MRNQTYDARLLLYQGLISLPLEILMLDTYSTLKQKEFKSYLLMGALNIGTTISALELGKILYAYFHETNVENLASKDVDVYISPIRASHYAYFTNSKSTSNIHLQPKREDKLLQKIQDAPLFTEAYMNLVYTLFGVKVGYGLGASSSPNIFSKALYALSQPLAVTLKDSGRLR